MRIGRDVTVGAVALLLGLAGASRAQDAKQPVIADPAGGLFQSLSLGSGKGPVRIDSDTLEIDYKTSNILYRGHVQVTQGDVRLDSDTLAIRYDPRAVKRTPDGVPTAAATGPAGKAAGAGTDAERIKEIVAEGNVRIRQGTKLAEGRRAVFDQAQQTFTLSDGAVLHDGPNQVAGERVIVYLKEERSVVESGAKTRVKAVLYPNAKESGDAKAAASPARTAAPPAAAAAAEP
ncbi:MAG: hypothetical protein B6D46_02810 [Polyangiaceae bacterium UTPRO1]|jgi:lipopolysaccharide export system protein LptA|nr:hypothetical protein [Myxococcales bacterium]OQY68591.1 MAG: hypothetical protein B6D46_02810 [Polyangiaceae bacterium UTPRO1]